MKMKTKKKMRNLKISKIKLMPDMSDIFPRKEFPERKLMFSSTRTLVNAKTHALTNQTNAGTVANASNVVVSTTDDVSELLSENIANTNTPPPANSAANITSEPVIESDTANTNPTSDVTEAKTRNHANEMLAELSTRLFWKARNSSTSKDTHTTFHTHTADSTTNVFIQNHGKPLPIKWTTTKC
ncbi:uncharacterized protein [Clytia hemisphaerica]|uniref:uncharacterized protein n=1 Tax=Clytia hemisphaerica TaxID=252671 RepID=UPI0034D64589